MLNSRTIVLGTRNRKKLGELVDLLAPHGFELKTLTDFPQAIEVVEDGDSFAANAGLKASKQAIHLGQWVLGEDSGLCVDALGGTPGIYSARYSGENATDARNNERLLKELGDLPLEKRTAYYVCHMSLSDPEGNICVESEDYCRGRMRFEPSGAGGFGYDPLFEVTEYHRTFGELGLAVKGVLSHRSRAVRAFIPKVVELVRSGGWKV